MSRTPGCVISRLKLNRKGMGNEWPKDHTSRNGLTGIGQLMRLVSIALRTQREPENDSGRNHTLTSHHTLHWNGITLFEDRSQEKGVRDAFVMHSRLVTETDAESGPERQFTTPT